MPCRKKLTRKQSNVLLFLMKVFVQQRKLSIKQKKHLTQRFMASVVRIWIHIEIQIPKINH